MFGILNFGHALRVRRVLEFLPAFGMVFVICEFVIWVFH